MSRPLRIKLIVAALFGLTVMIGYWKLGDVLTLKYMASQELGLRNYQQQHPGLTYFIALVIYVTVTGLSIPGATALSLLYAWFFGLLRAVVLVSFASTAGATLAFLLSRYLFQTAIQNKFGDRLGQFNEALQKNGALYLFTLRLIPAIPFFVINVVMGLTPLKTSTYWWVSQLGMLPGTIVYVYAGSLIPTLNELADRGTSGILSFRIVIALLLLGVFPLLARYTISRFAPNSQ